ncbi:MAG: PH domain-containing protein [Thermoplasmata archaeon]
MTDKPEGLTLGPDEKVVWTGNRSFLSFILSAGKGLMIFIGGLVLFSIIAVIVAVGSETVGIGESCCGSYLVLFGVIIFGVLAAKVKYQYAITNKRVYARKGIVGRKVSEIPLNKVVNTTYEQGFIGRTLGFGNLQFNSAAGADQGVVFKGIKNVKSIDQRFKQIRSQYVGRNESRNIQQTVNIAIPDDRRQEPKKPKKPKKVKVLEPKDDKKKVEKEKPKLESKSQKVKKKKRKTLKKKKKECPECGEKIDREWLVCGYCGERIAKRCPECDNIMALDNYKCKKCGYEITENCDNCDFEIRKDRLEDLEFCPECGEKISEVF